MNHYFTTSKNIPWSVGPLRNHNHLKKGRARTFRNEPNVSLLHYDRTGDAKTMRYQLLRSAAKDLKVLYVAFFANGMIHSILPTRRLAFVVRTNIQNMSVCVQCTSQGSKGTCSRNQPPTEEEAHDREIIMNHYFTTSKHIPWSVGPLTNHNCFRKGCVRTVRNEPNVSLLHYDRTGDAKTMRYQLLRSAEERIWRFYMSYGQNLVHGEGTSLSRVGLYRACSGRTLYKTFWGYRFGYRFRVGPYQFCSNRNPTTLSILLWSCLILSDAHMLLSWKRGCSMAILDSWLAKPFPLRNIRPFAPWGKYRGTNHQPLRVASL